MQIELCCNTPPMKLGMFFHQDTLKAPSLKAAQQWLWCCKGGPLPSPLGVAAWGELWLFLWMTDPWLGGTVKSGTTGPVCATVSWPMAGLAANCLWPSGSCHVLEAGSPSIALCHWPSWWACGYSRCKWSEVFSVMGLWNALVVLAPACCCNLSMWHCCCTQSHFGCCCYYLIYLFIMLFLLFSLTASLPPCCHFP